MPSGRARSDDRAPLPPRGARAGRLGLDSPIVTEWGANWQWGRITLSGGKARFEISYLSIGPLLYFDGSDGRVITMTPDFGGWYVYVTPLK